MSRIFWRLHAVFNVYTPVDAENVNKGTQRSRQTSKFSMSTIISSILPTLDEVQFHFRTRKGQWVAVKYLDGYGKYSPARFLFPCSANFRIPVMLLENSYAAFALKHDSANPIPLPPTFPSLICDPWYGVVLQTGEVKKTRPYGSR